MILIVYKLKLPAHILFATCVIALAKSKSSCFVPVILKSFLPFLVGTDASKLPFAIICLKCLPVNLKGWDLSLTLYLIIISIMNILLFQFF